MKPTREPFPAMPTTYSVGSQTFQRRMYFQNERWARLFIETLYHYRQTGIFKLHAFVVMPEHFHILLTPSTTLERTVQYLKGGFSRKARLKFHWKFPIWQNSFTDHRIRDAVDCDNHIQYIYLNPIRRKLCGVGKSQTNSLCDTRFDTLETVKIIPAKASAIPFILSVQRACPAASQWKPTDYTAAIAQPDRLVLIAEKDSKILGFAVVYTGIPEWELENVAVAPDSRRSGIGRALMAALINLARKAGATEIRQEIRISNTAAQKLGLSVGFIQEGRRPDYYRDRVEDALLFKHLLGRQ
ncbi:MAG: ribosomal-protein-alanine N-acetyltransferase [Acidobacteria bacterium]|nr:MAG: ribosomal-protein-alanine N-acetyltransferase [Acidobacteriota bacterium]